MNNSKYKMISWATTGSSTTTKNRNCEVSMGRMSDYDPSDSLKSLQQKHTRNSATANRLASGESHATIGYGRKVSVSGKRKRESSDNVEQAREELVLSPFVKDGFAFTYGYDDSDNKSNVISRSSISDNRRHQLSLSSKILAELLQEEGEEKFQPLTYDQKKYEMLPGNDKELGLWIDHQRCLYRQERLQRYRCDQLNSINFDCGPKWKDMFIKLCMYKIEHNGSTRVSEGKLGNWAFTQRNSYHRKKLSKERICLLESIGFEWSQQNCENGMKTNSSLSNQVVTRQSTIDLSLKQHDGPDLSHRNFFRSNKGFSDDFLRRRAANSSILTNNTNSRTAEITSPSINLIPRPSQPSTVVLATSVIPTKTSNKSFPQQTDKLITVPGELDVLMGRGQYKKGNPGNLKLINLLKSYLGLYKASGKFDKTVLSELVVSTMIEAGSRFLLLQAREGIWAEVSHEKARAKVAHDFRNLIKTQAHV